MKCVKELLKQLVSIAKMVKLALVVMNVFLDINALKARGQYNRHSLFS